MALNGEKHGQFMGGGDRNSLKFTLEDRLQKNGTLHHKSAVITFPHQKEHGVDFMQYGKTFRVAKTVSFEDTMESDVKGGNTTGANRFRTPNEVHDIEAQVETTIYRKGPDGQFDPDKEFGVDFFRDEAAGDNPGSGGTKGFRQKQARDNIGRHNGQPTEYNPDNTVYRKAMPAPGGYSAPGIDSGTNKGVDFFSDQGDSGKNLKGFTLHADNPKVSDYGNNQPDAAADNSVYRNNMNTERYHSGGIKAGSVD